MCVGENCAPQAVHYMNAQLTALYENAVSCIKHHDVAQKEPAHTRYSHALADFSFVDPYLKGHHTMFQAAFGKPELEFICNHDAILRLKIHKGYYRLDYNKASNMSYSEKDRLQSLHEVELAFRVRFDIHRVHGKDAKIGNGHNLVKLVILDLPKAEMISVKPAIIIGRDAFSYYLSQYLEFLHQAGNHVFFSLPDFDDDRYRLTIDYSLMDSTIPEVEEVYGISVEKINTYLSSVWLKAAMLLGGPQGPVTDWKHTCLAEYRSTWSQHKDSEVHYHVRLGAPRIKPICSREVVLYLPVDEVFFYDSTDFDVEPIRQYSGWEIAILVNVIHEKDSEHVTRCTLDLTTVRPYHQHCQFIGIDETDELALSFCTSLSDFFTSGYLDILESVEFHVIYHFDSRWHDWHGPLAIGEGEIDETDETEITETEEEWTVTHESSSIRVKEWVETMTRCTSSSFDQITAISQSSMNAQFTALYEMGLVARATEYTSVLAKWSHEEYFSATFKPITLRLLSNGRAIVWIHMEHGHLKTLKNWQLHDRNEKYDFDGWHLAFEVDLRKCSHAELDVSESWRSQYKDSAVFKAHGDRQDRRLEHLYLDLHHAEFLHEFSSLEGLFQRQDHRPIDKVQAAVHYIKSYYLPQLMHWGLHILYTVPIWTSGSVESLSSCALTSIAFHVYSKTKITRHTWAQTSVEPAIVVLGMTGFRSLVSKHLEYSGNWVIRASKGVSYGTVCVSRSTFMEKRVLHLLTRINALTTVVPKFYGVHNGVWKLDLTTWAQHDWRKDQECNWVLDSDREGIMRYKWQHRDVWHYEHEGSGEVANGTYSVSCLTRNFVELPVATKKRSLDIKIWGEVDLEMSYKAHTQSGSAKSSARWEALIAVQTDLDGLRVNVIGTPTVHFDKTHFSGDAASAKFTDLHTSLQAHLPPAIDLSSVLRELKTFEGAWQYGFPGMQAYCLANPVLNKQGDMLFELRLHGQQSTGTTRSSGFRSVSATVSPRGTMSRSSGSFLGRVRTALSSAIHENGGTNGHAVTTHNGANGHTNGTYTLKTMSITNESKSETEVYEDAGEEFSQSSFRVSEATSVA